MIISFVSHSEFLPKCVQVISDHRNQLNEGIDIEMDPGGYDGSVSVTIEAEDATGFETNWNSGDPTRFPARIRAAATALSQCGCSGTFQISVKNGVLTIKGKDAGNDGWNNAELLASVEAYVEMLAQYHRGQAIVKKAYYERLAQRFGRTSKAFEYRMQNISYVYSLLGREWLPGLKPTKHVGNHVATQIETFISEVEGKKSVPIVDFEVKVKELQHKPLAKPTGQAQPSSTVTAITQYARDPAVKAWVLQNANDHCECCGSEAPFRSLDGFPYLEVHHVRKLADGGSDTVENVVAICPKCHRQLHYGSNALGLVEKLYHGVECLVKE